MVEANIGLTDRMLDAEFWMKVRTRHDGCFASLAKLAAEHPDVFAFESGVQIARRCRISQTTVVRFAHHLGLGGLANEDGISTRIEKALQEEQPARRCYQVKA